MESANNLRSYLAISLCHEILLREYLGNPFGAVRRRSGYAVRDLLTLSRLNQNHPRSRFVPIEASHPDELDMTEFLSLRASPRAAGPDKEEGITNRPAASTGRAGSPPLRVASLGADSLCRYCIESMLRDIGGGVEAMHATDAQQIAQRVSDGDHIDLVLIVAMCPGGLTLSQFDAVRVALPGIPIAVHSSRDDPAH